MTSHILSLEVVVAIWKLHEAKARFSEMIEAARKKGPQIVTKRGIETAVLVPIDEWNRLKTSARPSAKDVLLGPGPRFDDLMIPPRRAFRRRKPVEFE